MTHQHANWIIWVKVFKNGPSKICGRQSLKSLKWYGLPKQSGLFKGCLPKLTWSILDKTKKLIASITKISFTSLCCYCKLPEVFILGKYVLKFDNGDTVTVPISIILVSFLCVPRAIFQYFLLLTSTMVWTIRCSKINFYIIFFNLGWDCLWRTYRRLW